MKMKVRYTRTTTHGGALSDQVTNHHVLLYLLISGCQSVLSAAGGLVGAVVALWPHLPLVLRQVPVSQRQRSQTICRILLETNIIYTDMYQNIQTFWHEDARDLMRKKWMLSKSLAVFNFGDTRWQCSSTQPFKRCVYSHWGGQRWYSSVPGYRGGVSPTARCQLLYSTDGSYPLGYALRMNNTVWWRQNTQYSTMLHTTPPSPSNNLLFLSFNKCHSYIQSVGPVS